MFYNQWLNKAPISSQLCESKPTMLSCSPSDIDQEINYTVIMDNAMGPDITESNLRLTLLPNPFFIGILESNRMVPTGISSTITITVCHSGKGFLVVQINNLFFMNRERTWRV